MANLSTWSRSVPSGASLQREFDDLYRSDKSILEETLNSEHYFVSSSKTSAGVHRLGSARIYMGTRSQVSSPADAYGRLMYASDTSSLHLLGASSSTTLFSGRMLSASGDSVEADSTYTLVRLRLTATNDVGPSTTSHALEIGNAALNLRLDGNEVAAYSNATSSDLHLNRDGGNVFISDNTVWHAGNDGAGSGLDADTVDGINFSSVTSAIAALGVAGSGNDELDFAFSSATYGDAIVLGYRGDSGLVLQPRVSSPGTVSVVIHNLFGSVQTLNAQTIRLTRISG